MTGHYKHKKDDYIESLHDWLSVSYLLSLDIVSSLYSEMGLKLPHSAGIPKLFRTSVLKIKKQGRINDSIISELKDQLGNIYGEENLHFFMTWFLNVFRERPENPWYQWKRLFESVNSEFYQELYTTAKISQNKLDSMRKYEEYCFYWKTDQDDPTVNLLKCLRKQELSSWDREFCQENDLYLEERNLEYPSTDEKVDIFLEPIRLISMKRMQAGWKDLWERTSSKEKENIVTLGETWLSSISGEREVLAHPDILEPTN